MATDVGGVADYVVGDRGGSLVLAGDADALADGLTRWLADDGRRRAAAVFNRQRVLEHFSWRASAERLLEVYREVLDRRLTRARISA